MKILIVEDEVGSREGLSELLGRLSEDYIVIGKASDGEEGVKLAQELKPDLIFADIDMPKLNGLDMIGKIKEENFDPFVVILSGYSDFKYAQKGISLGISEYLLKPITYSNLKNIMVEMNRKISQKNYGNERTMAKDELLKNILLNKRKDIKKSIEFILKNIDEAKNMYLINIYLDGKQEDENQLMLQEIYKFVEHYNIKTFFYSFIDEYSYLTVFINYQIELSELTKMLKYNLLFSARKNKLSDISISFLHLNKFNDIIDSLEKLKSLSKWFIILGTETIVTEQLISSMKISNCIYPRNIENEALLAIKDNDFDKLFKLNEKLIQHFKIDLFSPNQIIDLCENYVFSILIFLKGINNNYYNELKNERFLDEIKHCNTIDKLKSKLDLLVQSICKRYVDNYTTISLPVRKTMNYINEYYNDKISLEEIASKMNITPEYLSRLFTKEIGKSFSDYLKEYRIEKAKKLLNSFGIKVYEVAEQVGYSDPKYFCKIFKDVTGISPKEYMKFL